MDGFIIFLSRAWVCKAVTQIDQVMDKGHHMYLWEYPESIIWC